MRRLHLFVATLFIVNGIYFFSCAAETESPRAALPEMDQEARDWLDSPGSEAFGKWLVKMLGLHPEHPEWLTMFAEILWAVPEPGWES